MCLCFPSGLLYLLSRMIALAAPALQLATCLRQMGAASILRQLLRVHGEDQDVMLGSHQLLGLVCTQASAQ